LEAFVRKTPTFWATAVAIALAFPAFAQEAAKDHVKELIAQAMQQAGQTAPAAPAVQALPEAGPRTPLSADEAVRRALERNLDIQVQRLEPQLLDYQVAALWANYRPTLTSSVFTQGQTNLPADQLQGGVGASANQIINDTAQWNAGMQQNFRWGGGNAAGDHAVDGAAESVVHLVFPGAVHPAAAPELPDRPDAVDADDPDAAGADH
jgi:hypothetical protein